MITQTLQLNKTKKEHDRLDKPTYKTFMKQEQVFLGLW